MLKDILKSLASSISIFVGIYMTVWSFVCFVELEVFSIFPSGNTDGEQFARGLVFILAITIMVATVSDFAEIARRRELGVYKP